MVRYFDLARSSSRVDSWESRASTASKTTSKSSQSTNSGFSNSKSLSTSSQKGASVTTTSQASRSTVSQSGVKVTLSSTLTTDLKSKLQQVTTTLAYAIAKGDQSSIKAAQTTRENLQTVLSAPANHGASPVALKPGMHLYREDVSGTYKTTYSVDRKEMATSQPSGRTEKMEVPNPTYHETVYSLNKEVEKYNSIRINAAERGDLAAMSDAAVMIKGFQQQGATLGLDADTASARALRNYYNGVYTDKIQKAMKSGSTQHLNEAVVQAKNDWEYAYKTKDPDAMAAAEAIAGAMRSLGATIPKDLTLEQARKYVAAAPSTQPSTSSSSSGGQKVGNFLGGVKDGIIEGVKDTVHVVTHPIETGKAIGTAVTNPQDTYNSLKQSAIDYYERYNAATPQEKARMAGEVVGNILLGAAGSKGAGTVTGAIKDAAKDTVKTQAVHGIEITNKVTKTPEETNQWWAEMGYQNPPYKPGTTVTEFQLLKDTTFVRVYDGQVSGKFGGWVMKAEDIKGLTPEQIREKFALPAVPKYVVDVKLKAGTQMRSGTANEVEGWGKGGGKVGVFSLI